MKKSEVFRFEFPVKQKVVRDLKIVTETVGTLTAECTLYYRNELVEIDAVYYEGVNVLPLLQATDAFTLPELQECAEKESLKLSTHPQNIAA